MPKRSNSKRKRRQNIASFTKKKLLAFIKNITRRTSKTFRRFRKQKGG